MTRIGLFVAGAVCWTVALAACAQTPAVAPREAVIENAALRVVAAPGRPGVAVHYKSAGLPRRVELALVARGAAESAPLTAAEVVPDDAGGAALRVNAGAAEARIALGPSVYIQITPGPNAAAVEVRTGARYAVLPDFFADDLVFDPVKLAMPRLTVPAENFLLQFLEGGDSLVMCIWPGRLKLPRPGAATGAVPAAAPATPDTDPQVDLLFAGAGPARRLAASRIEFQNQSVYVGVLEQPGLWHDEDVSAWPGYQPAAITWQRPFEAKWRGDFIVAAGKRLADWPTRTQSFEFQSTSTARADKWWERGTDPLDARFAAATSNPKPTKWWERGDENAPQIWQESLASFFIYPAVLKGDQVRLCLYADKSARGAARQATDAARKANPAAPEVPPANVFDHVLIYPLSRAPATPISVYTPVDLMRETLGAGPCEYVLDIAGIKPRSAGGDRPILSYATCGLWNDHISPIVSRLKKKPDGTFERLDEPTQAHLIQALEEMWYFVHAVHDRLREYRQWGTDLAQFCAQESARNPQVKLAADQVLVHVQRLNADMARHKFEGPGSEAYWKDRVPELVKQVQAGAYAEVGSVGKIRDLGNDQDERVSRCRQYVKALRQEVLMQDASDPEVRRFLAAVRDRCHQMLRNMHPKEGF